MGKYETANVPLGNSILSDVAHVYWRKQNSKMPSVRNANSLVKSIEMPSGLQLAMKGKLFCLLPFENCIVLRGYNDSETHAPCLKRALK